MSTVQSCTRQKRRVARGVDWPKRRDKDKQDNEKRQFENRSEGERRKQYRSEGVYQEAIGSSKADFRSVKNEMSELVSGQRR